MSKIMAFLGVLVVTVGIVIWKSIDETEAVADKGGSGGKKTNGTDMQVADKKLSTKTSYKNPAGDDEVGFNLMVNGEGAIVDATVDILAIHAVSKTRQLAFSEGLAGAIKGKKLSELSSIDRVGGSSLTTGAFNASLAQLKGQL